MYPLSPTVTSRLALEVYALSKQPSLRLAMRQLQSTFGDNLSFTQNNLLYGETGPVGIKISSAFGFVLTMNGTAKGQAIILFRGTQSLGDWLTNANVMTSGDGQGNYVHDGFNKAFKSMQPTIKNLLDELNGIHTVHCIGHSLGGALATICANWLQSHYRTYVYTYGSPRVGLHQFAKSLTKTMGENIYRVYHKTDPVPFIPTWPFVHVPEGVDSYLLYSPGDFFTAKYHSMKEYSSKVKNKSWQEASQLHEAPKDQLTIIRWLKSEIKAKFGFESMCNLNDALIYILRLAGYVVPLVVTCSKSLIDSISFALNKSLNLVKSIAALIVLFVKKVFEILGTVREVEVDLLSTQFLKELLFRLQEKVNSEAQKALRIGLA